MDTTETIPSDVGFPHFGTVHLVWLSIFAILSIASCFFYRKLNDNGKRIWRIVVACLLLADEAFKDVMLILGDRFRADYLPLHLCSINIILIAIYTWRPSKLLGGYLYTVGIPGAIAALLFPSWTSLPLGNFMHLHSFTVHILLALYPIVLTAAGELRPEVKRLPQYLGLLVGMAIPIYGINLLLDTNFMFLMSADEGNPLYLFEQLWGSHLLGFPVIIAGVLLVMYVPLVIIRKIRCK
jgi:hypothetical integral membrane protein (TIGR02206 family)